MIKQFYYKRNRLQQLRGFCSAVQLSSISKAAELMNLSQSTVTLQIQSLERDFKIKLFLRNGKGLELTSEGKLLYDMSLKHLNAIDSIFDNFTKLRNKIKQNEITIAAHHVVISFLLPNIIAKFTKDNPDCHINIKNISPDQAIQDLQNDKLDFIIYPDIKFNNNLQNIRLISYDPILIMPKNHPLEKIDKVTLEDIAKFNSIRIDKKLITLPGFEDKFQKYQFKTNITFENANWDIIKHFVKSSIGVGFVSEICIDKNDSNLIYKNLNHIFPQMEYSITSKKGKIHSRIISDFIDFMRDNVK
jgi:DNA-binding transcriptional LysR family regulator